MPMKRKNLFKNKEKCLAGALVLIGECPCLSKFGLPHVATSGRVKTVELFLNNFWKDKFGDF